MSEIININRTERVFVEQTDSENMLTEIANGLLFDARATTSGKETISMPIAQLATLGGGVSSLLSALRTVTQTQTTTVNTQGLYRLANEAVGDTLKVAKMETSREHSKQRTVLQNLLSYSLQVP